MPRKIENLVQRNGWYYCRMRCPQHLIRSGLPAEKSISLATKNRAQAIERLDAARREVMAFFRDELPRPSPLPEIRPAVPTRRRPDHPDLPILDENEAASLAVRTFEKMRAGLDHDTAEVMEMSIPERRRYRLEQEDYLAELDGGGDDPDGEHPVARLEIGVLHDAGRRSPYNSVASRLLRSYLVRALRQVVAIGLARLDGDYRDDVTDSLFLGLRVYGPQHLISDGQRGATRTELEEVLRLWEVERQPQPKTVDAHAAVCRWLHDRVGKLAVEEITPDHVILFKDRLNAEGCTPVNINVKLQRLSTLLRFAVARRLIKENPVHGISIQVKGGRRAQRRSFDLASLNAIFSSPVYRDDARPPRGRGEAAYWLPLLALFSGARLEELAQLRPDDVRSVEYLDDEDTSQKAWFIRITETGDDEDDEGERSSRLDGPVTHLKNENSIRDVPVHPALEALGFLDFVTQARSDGQERLFKHLTPNKYDRLGAKWAEWWSIYRRDVCGVSDRRMVFHSFRHTFKFYARHAGIVEGVQRQLMGHSPGDTASNYAPEGYSPFQCVQSMRRYRVPGLLMPAPPPTFRARGASRVPAPLAAQPGRGDMGGVV